MNPHGFNRDAGRVGQLFVWVVLTCLAAVIVALTAAFVRWVL